jgi:hypothetical protein
VDGEGVTRRQEGNPSQGKREMDGPRHAGTLPPWWWSVKPGDGVRRDSGETMDGIEKIHGSSQAMARQMGELEERVSAIGKIVDLIDRVAEQTRLLAFNATVIASTSGDSGRAFGVVAEQMKDLARRTSDATRDIARLIDDIQQGTRVVVGSMEIGLADVDQGISLGREHHACAGVPQVGGPVRLQGHPGDDNGRGPARHRPGRRHPRPGA